MIGSLDSISFPNVIIRISATFEKIPSDAIAKAESMVWGKTASSLPITWAKALIASCESADPACKSRAIWEAQPAGDKFPGVLGQSHKIELSWPSNFFPSSLTRADFPIPVSPEINADLMVPAGDKPWLKEFNSVSRPMKFIPFYYFPLYSNLSHPLPAPMVQEGSESKMG